MLGTSDNETVNIGTECPFPDSESSETPVIKSVSHFLIIKGFLQKIYNKEKTN